MRILKILPFWLLSLCVIFQVMACQSDDYEVPPVRSTTPTATDDNDNQNNIENDNEEQEDEEDTNLSYLALGDSYTIGQNVCESCRFPVQLVTAYNNDSNKTLSVKIIATTGWRTDNLIDAIDRDDPATDYDLVTLLIGVNNQYQGRPFTQYQEEFVALLETAIILANGNKDHVVVLSIPDYAFTPFGQSTGNPEQITTELNAYNAFAKNTSDNYNITFLNITDISRRGLDEPNLVASDGLHPSEEAYRFFIERLLPIVKNKIGE